MKKTALAALILFLTLGITSSHADPGPYGTKLSGDDCDSSSDGVATPCQANNGLDIFNAVNHVFVTSGFANPGYTKNEQLDPKQLTSPHAYWKDISGSKKNGFARISITAANTNTLGIFPASDPTLAKFFPPGTTGNQFLGDGSFVNPYPGAINPFIPENFGFALKTVRPNGITTNIWYSDPGLNSDGLDRMIAYHLPDLDGAKMWIEVDTNDDGVLDDKILLTLNKDTYLLGWEDRISGIPQFDEDYNDSIFLITKVQPVPEPMTLALFATGLAGLSVLRRSRRQQV